MSTTTQLDANQVIKRVYDEGTGSLKVVGLDPIVSRLAADTDSVAIGDLTATNFLIPNSDGSLPITDNGASLTVDGTVAVSNFPGTQTVDGSVLTNPSVVDTTLLISALAAGSDDTSDPINCLSYRVVGLMANWASLDQADATLQFQGSLDDVIYEDVGSPYTLATASGQKSFSLIDEPYKYVRIVYTHGTVTTGTLTVKYILRA